MLSENDASAHPRPIADQMQPAERSEFVTSVAHFYRGELSRMITWRDRLDHTTNWAIAATAGMLSVSLSSAASHHAVILCCMALVFLLLLIESRRYRFLDVSRQRVRLLERNYYARLFDDNAHEDTDNWLQRLSADLQHPHFGINLIGAMQNRVRRNYFWIYLPLFLSWWLKISTNVLNASRGDAEFVHSSAELLDNARVAYIPGALVMGGVSLFFILLLGLIFVRLPESRKEDSIDADV